MKRVFVVANALMTVAFLLGVVVQYNDPDPARWMAIYGAAAVACLLPAHWRPARVVAPLVFAVALVWAATLVSGIGGVQAGELFEEWEMKSPAVEQAREFGGLAIIAAWMAVLGLRAWRARAT